MTDFWEAVTDIGFVVEHAAEASSLDDLTCVCVLSLAKLPGNHPLRQDRQLAFYLSEDAQSAWAVCASPLSSAVYGNLIPVETMAPPNSAIAKSVIDHFGGYVSYSEQWSVDHMAGFDGMELARYSYTVDQFFGFANTAVGGHESRCKGIALERFQEAIPEGDWQHLLTIDMWSCELRKSEGAVFFYVPKVDLALLNFRHVVAFHESF